MGNDGLVLAIDLGSGGAAAALIEDDLGVGTVHESVWRFDEDTPVLATPVGVHAGVKADIRALVVSDEGTGVVAQEFRGRKGIVFRPRVFLERERFETIPRVQIRPATSDTAVGPRTTHLRLLPPI